MSDKHGMSRAAEVLAGVGTTRELATALGKSPGTVGDYRTGRRRPAPEVIRAIASRWPQVPAELWDAPPRAQQGAQAPRVEPQAPSLPDDDSDALDGLLDATAEGNATELHALIQGDLDRLRGPEGEQLELGKRSEVIRRLVAASAVLAKTTQKDALTVEQVVASSGGRELLAQLADALSAIPAGGWAIEHAGRALASGLDEEARDLLRRQVAAGYSGDLARTARATCPDCVTRGAATRAGRALS